MADEWKVGDRIEVMVASWDEQKGEPVDVWVGGTVGHVSDHIIGVVSSDGREKYPVQRHHDKLYRRPA